MKKALCSSTILVIALAFVSCSKGDHQNEGNTAQNLELRAKSLGFSNATQYKGAVVEQCAAGNHQNCDILNSGNHQVCGDLRHSGKNHDGTHHNGIGHGTYDANGHSPNGHSQGKNRPGSSNHYGSHH